MGAFLNPPPPPAIVIVEKDGGGLVADYEAAVSRYNAENRRVEIRGSCRSACSLALGVKNVCVGKGAVVKWHQAYEKYTGAPRPDITERMLGYLPWRVRNQVRGKIQERYSPGATLTQEQLIALGIPDCDTVVAKDVNVEWRVFPLVKWAVKVK